MTEPVSDSAQQRTEGAADGPDTETYVLKLYVTGTTPRSVLAVENLRRMCDQHLSGRYNLQVIDIYQQPEFAKAEQIIAAPTLVKQLPAPLQRFVGDLSDEDKVLAGLGVPRAPGV